MTKKCEQEIAKIQAEIAELEKLRDRLTKGSLVVPSVMRHTCHKEVQKCSGKIWKREARIEELKRQGISTSERTKLLGHAQNKGITLWKTYDLYATSFVKLAHLAPYGYYTVAYTFYSWMLQNVKGCASDAGKRQVDEIKFLMEEEAHALYEKGEVSRSGVFSQQEYATAHHTAFESLV
jgi:hypothetical protein